MCLVITNVLIENSTLVPVVFVLIAVACVGVGYLILRTRRHGNRALWILVLLSVLPVAVLPLVPTSTGGDGITCTIQFHMPTPGSVELLANAALFLPPVFFATLATRRRLLMLAAGAVLSGAIEALQAVVPAIGRACDTNDWTMNTVGAALAVLLATATIALADRTAVRKAERVSADPPPGNHPQP
ncbi:VanZ like protein [Haloactinopolyspora alba]|uniref:VanZ like protein n=1 Tax=Haloactinopolyspora alba TaxID=648780 RepID=A0A2P8EF57_9ACTN|nr:VanZ like protein [Haloactinopolyspora alba]